MIPGRLTIALVSSYECLRPTRRESQKVSGGRVRSRNCVTAAVSVENDRRQNRRGSKEPSWKRRGHRPFSVQAGESHPLPCVHRYPLSISFHFDPLRRDPFLCRKVGSIVGYYRRDVVDACDNATGWK